MQDTGGPKLRCQSCALARRQGAEQGAGAAQQMWDTGGRMRRCQSCAHEAKQQHAQSRGGMLARTCPAPERSLHCTQDIPFRPPESLFGLTSKNSFQAVSCAKK
eukprot:1159905-Pelagomonas_calceolata.AAC.5